MLHGQHLHSSNVRFFRVGGIDFTKNSKKGGYGKTAEG